MNYILKTWLNIAVFTFKLTSLQIFAFIATISFEEKTGHKTRNCHEIHHVIL